MTTKDASAVVECPHFWLGSTDAGWSCGGCGATLPGCDACHPLEGGKPASHTEGPDCERGVRKEDPMTPEHTCMEQKPFPLGSGLFIACGKPLPCPDHTEAATYCPPPQKGDERHG